MTGRRGLRQRQTSTILSSFMLHPSPFMPCHTFRHSFPTPSLDSRLVSKQCSPAFRGTAHEDVRTTMIYTHVFNWAGKGVKSPVDNL